MSPEDSAGPEFLEAYNRDGSVLKKGPKNQLIDEQRTVSMEHGDSPFALKGIFLFLSHPEQGLYIVRRANVRENPNLLCKSVGGHCRPGEDPDAALERECGEEIGKEIVKALNNAKK